MQEVIATRGEITTVNQDYHAYLDTIESAMKAVDNYDYEANTSDFFCGGMYIRSVLIPAGYYVISKIHKFDHTFILSEGIITIFTEEGEQVISAPPMFLGVTKAGTRRFARAETDVIWTTHHRTDKLTVEEVEQDIIITREEHRCLGYTAE